MLNNDGQTVTDNYFNQFYESKNYQERLEAIRYLINVSGKYPFSSKIFIDALKDFCSQVKIYVLQHYDFQNNKSPEIELRLEDIAKNESIIKSHILFICEDIIATSNKDLIQLLIMELHKFISGNQLLCGGNTELNYFLNKTIDLLLEKKLQA